MLAMPQYLYRSLAHHEVNLPGLAAVNFCYEEWPFDHGRGYYSVFIMLVQFFVPMLFVTVSYGLIVRKLKCRMVRCDVKSHYTIKRDDNRSRKTSILLIAIAIIFFISWLPFNIFNIVVDFSDLSTGDTHNMLLIYAICHLLGMSSACSNPVLYGWFNYNFRKEFREILDTFPCCNFLVKHIKVCSPRTSIAFQGSGTLDDPLPCNEENSMNNELILMIHTNHSKNNSTSQETKSSEVLQNEEAQETSRILYRNTDL